LAGVEQAVNAKVDGGRIADYYPGVVKEHLVWILAAWSVLVFGLIESRGGVVGDEWYLVSREGKLLRKLDWKRGDLLDPEAGQIYRLEGNVLKTYRVEDGAITWSAQWPVMQTTDAAFFQSDPDAVALLAAGVLYGYEKRTGKELYRTPLGTPQGQFSMPLSSARGIQWGLSANGEDGKFLYLTRQKTGIVKRANGHMESVSLQAATIAKFELRTGREVWEGTFETNMVVWTISAGTAAGQTQTIYFDPATGLPLTNVGSTAEVLFKGKIGFCVLAGEPDSLVAIETGTQKVLWRLNSLSVKRILEPCAYDRLLCASATGVKVVDIAGARVQAEFSLPKPENARFIQTKSAIIAQDYQKLRVINADTGATLWESQATGSGPEIVDRQEEQVLIPARTTGTSIREAKFGVVALAMKSGRPIWRWQVPDGPWGDSVGVTIQNCPAGFIVDRHWLVFE
jgi:outer membrane protein assembly factor BamB